jgi:hypothetical protein
VIRAIASSDALANFVEDALGQGHPRSRVEDALEQAGWPPGRIHAALGAFAPGEFPISGAAAVALGATGSRTAGAGPGEAIVAGAAMADVPHALLRGVRAHRRCHESRL